MDSLPTTPDEYRAWWLQTYADIPYGVCVCGCGRKTPIAAKTAVKKRIIKGEPTRFVRGGHASNMKRSEQARQVVLRSSGQQSWFCNCGCGQRVKAARDTRLDRGQVRGGPLSYIKGHERHKPGPAYIETDCGADSPCWIWQHFKDEKGYGRQRVNGAIRGVHRMFYEKRFGPISDGLQLHHLCGIKSCINPDHLTAVTPQEHSDLHADTGGLGSNRIPTNIKQKVVRMYAKGEWSQQALANHFGISQGSVSRYILSDPRMLG